MATTRPVKDIFRGYYDKGKISNRVMKTKVDYDRLTKNEQEYGTHFEEYVESQYRDWGVKYYHSKEEFYNDFNEHSPLSRDKIDERWQMYQHRDKLIRSGQYEDIRLQQYKDVYIKSMKATGFTEEEIYNIEKLSLSSFKKLVGGIDFDKTNPNKTYLPILGEFIYMYKQEGLAEDSNLPEYQHRLRLAFQEANMEFKEDIEEVKNNRIKRNYTKRMLKLIPKRERVFISNNPEQQQEDIEMFATSDRLTFKNKKDIIRRFPSTHKYAGEYFIPGVGSTISKNPEVANYVKKIAN